MKSLITDFGTAVLALATFGVLIPSSAWAKSSSVASSHPANQARISTGTSNSASSSPYIHKPTGSGMTSGGTGNTTTSTDKNSAGYSHLPSQVYGASKGKTGIDSNLRIPVYRTSNVMDDPFGLGKAAGDIANGLGKAAKDAGDAIANSPPVKGADGAIQWVLGEDTNGNVLTNGSGGPPAPYDLPKPAPGSSNLASIANNNAKYYDRNAYIKPSNKNLVSKEIEKKYNDSHPIAQKNKVTGGGSSSNNQSGGSNGNGGGGSNGNGSGSSGNSSGGSSSNKPQKPFPMPTPFPFPTGSGGDGGSSGDVSPAVYTSDDPTPAEVTPTSATAPVADSSVDLVLEDVKLAASATLVAGPAYTVTFRNQGTAPAGKFEVAILAGRDGTRAEDVAQAVVEVPSLGAGEVKEVTLRLPQKALKLAAPNGKSLPFTRLVVAVDLMNTVAETDKSNNTAVVDRAALEGDAAN
jgi:hypothetical protein